MTYTWDPKVGRYRDARGRFVRSETVLQWARESIQATSNHVDALTDLLNSGRLSTDDWQLLFRQEIKEEYVAQYLAGRGGLEQMGPADWGWVGGKLNAQYTRYLARFAEEIEAGYLSPEQIAVRARMYIESAEQAYWRAYHISQVEAGYDEVLWALDPTVENHCDDCIAFAGMGWQKVADDPYGGCVPGSGCSACLGRCYCTLLFRRSSE